MKPDVIIQHDAETAGAVAYNYPLQAWGGSPLLNEVFSLYYSKNPSFFNLSQVVPELNVEFTGTTGMAPTVQLGPLGKQEVVSMFNKANGFTSTHPEYLKEEHLAAAPPNFAFTFEKLTISIYDHENGRRGKPLAHDDFKIITYGVFGVSNQKLVLTSLTSEVEGGSGGDNPLVKKIVNGYVLPSITKRVQSVTLPQFQNIFGTGLNAGISGVDVTGETFYLYAAISPSLFSETAARPAAKQSGAPMLNAFVSNTAVSVLASTLLRPVSTGFNKTTGGSFAGAGIKGTILMHKPAISIRGSSASASAAISIRAEGGVKAFGIWTWVPLPVPDTDVVIDIKLADNRTSAYIEITGVESIRVNLGNWPSILNPVKSAIEGLLNAVVGAFRGTISAAVAGIRLELFSLPNEIPGMNVPANMTFTQLKFSDSGVLTAIGLSSV